MNTNGDANITLDANFDPTSAANAYSSTAIAGSTEHATVAQIPTTVDNKKKFIIIGSSIVLVIIVLCILIAHHNE